MRLLLRALALAFALLAVHAPAKPAATGSTPAPTATPAAAPKPTGLVDCGREKIALLPDTATKDNAYALGWTLQRHRARAAVDWSVYDSQDPNGFINRYPTADRLAPGDYVLTYGIVDLRARRFTPLSGTDAYYPHKPNADQRIAWSDETGGVRFGLLGIDSGDLTVHRWLIEAGRGRVRVKELAPEADKAVHNFLRRHAEPPTVAAEPTPVDTPKPADGTKPPKPARRAKRVKAPSLDAYAVSFADPADTPASRFAANPFNAPGIVLPFRAFDPKNPEAANYGGTVKVKLPGGGIANVDGKKVPAPAPTPAATPAPATAAPGGAVPLVPVPTGPAPVVPLPAATPALTAPVPSATPASTEIPELPVH